MLGILGLNLTAAPIPAVGVIVVAVSLPGPANRNPVIGPQAAAQGNDKVLKLVVIVVTAKPSRVALIALKEIFKSHFINLQVSIGANQLPTTPDGNIAEMSGIGGSRFLEVRLSKSASLSAWITANPAPGIPAPASRDRQAVIRALVGHLPGGLRAMRFSKIGSYLNCKG